MVGYNKEIEWKGFSSIIFTEQRLGTRLAIEAIAKDGPVSPDFRDGLRVQEVVDAAIESDRQGGWILLPRGSA